MLEAGAVRVGDARPHDHSRMGQRGGAEPATGEATPSGPASVLKVADGGTGLRFNFPGVSPFRAISWDEWLDHFTSHDLTFVYDDAEPGRPTSARYRIVPASELSSR